MAVTLTEKEVSLKLDLLRQLQQEELFLKAESSFYEFYKLVWPLFDPSPYVDSPYIQVLCEHAEAVYRREITRMIVNIPPRCGKSTVYSVAFSPWVWIQDGGKEKFFNVTHSADLYEQNIRFMRRILNHPLFSNRWIKQEQRFNFSVDQNTKDLVELAQGGYQLGLSPKTKVLGKGFSICVMDDIVDAQKAKPSDVDIQAAIEYIDNTLPNRSNTHDDCIVLVMQRLSEKDPTQHLIDSFSDYFLLNLPAEYNPDKTYFSPLGEKWNDPRKIPGEILNKRWSKEFIASEKSKVLYWQTRYNQDPVNPTGNKIKSKDLQFYLIPEDNKSFEIKTCVFDFTFGSIVGGVHASRTATIHLGYKNGNYYLQDALFGTYDPTGQRDMAIDRKKMYPDSYFVVEEKANGAAIMSMIRRLFSDRPHLLQPITPHLFGTKSKDKVERLESIEYVFTQQRFHILSGQSWTGDVLKELLGFPNYRTDDLVDCIVYGIFFIEQMLSGKSSTGVLSSNVPRVENYNDQIRDKMQNTARMSENYITIDIIPELVQDWIETERGVDRYDLISSATSRDAVRSLWD